MSSPNPDHESLMMTLESYLSKTDPEIFAQILRTWSPALDPNHFIGDILHRAIFRGDIVVVRLLLNIGVSPRARQCCDPGYSPLLAAAQHGRLEMARLFWGIVGPQERFFPPSSRRTYDLTCLQVAARNDHADIVAFFLDVWDGWSDAEKSRALCDAAWAWCDDVVAFLLARVSYEPGVIWQALEEGLQRRMILPEYETKPCPTPEEYVGRYRLVCQLVDAGGNPDVPDTVCKEPPVHMASMYQNRIGALKRLLRKGANVNIQDSGGRTALHHVFKRPNASIATLWVLLQHGASMDLSDKQGETPIHAISSTGTLDQLLLCLSHSRDVGAAIHSKNLHGESLLHYAAAGGRRDIVEFLLSCGLDVNAENHNGWTPLMCALTPSRVKGVQDLCDLANLLLRHGANAQVVTEEGWTPLHALVTRPVSGFAPDSEERQGTVRLARELIARGAPVGAESRVVTSPSVTTNILDGVWGFRMKSFAEKNAVAVGGVSCVGIDTTPLMWAHRCRSMDVFDVLMVCLSSIPEHEIQ